VEQLAVNMRQFFGGEEFIPLHEPKFDEITATYVQECVETGWVSTAGKFVGKFEQEAAAFVGAQFGVAVSSGTSALHLSLIVAGVSPGDEVICPDITFVASANAISYVGAAPHFVDVNQHNMCIDVDKLALYLAQITKIENGKTINKNTGKPIAAILAVHAFGFSADVQKLQSLCSEYNIELVEDAACAIGAKDSRGFIGAHSKFATFSFNGNKVITGGSGGLVLTNDEAVQQKIKHLSTTAKVSHKWEYIHDEVGYNYRMPNINAAILLSQLEALDDILAKKRQLVKNYKSIIANVPDIDIVVEEDETLSNYWLICLRLSKSGFDARDSLLKLLNDRNMMARPLWRPISDLAPFAQSARSDLSQSKRLYEQIINVPSSPHLAKLV